MHETDEGMPADNSYSNNKHESMCNSRVKTVRDRDASHNHDHRQVTTCFNSMI